MKPPLGYQIIMENENPLPHKEATDLGCARGAGGGSVQFPRDRIEGRVLRIEPSVPGDLHQHPVGSLCLVVVLEPGLGRRAILADVALLDVAAARIPDELTALVIVVPAAGTTTGQNGRPGRGGTEEQQGENRKLQQ